MKKDFFFLRHLLVLVWQYVNASTMVCLSLSVLSFELIFIDFDLKIWGIIISLLSLLSAGLFLCFVSSHTNNCNWFFFLYFFYFVSADLFGDPKYNNFDISVACPYQTESVKTAVHSLLRRPKYSNWLSEIRKFISFFSFFLFWQGSNSEGGF